MRPTLILLRRPAAVAVAVLVIVLAAAATATAGTPSKARVETLSPTCDGSKLPTHDGFQKAPACVKTEMGEVAAENKDPQLLIVDAPKTVRSGQEIVLKVSTRNLVRDRFPPAGQGGYYREASHLSAEGLTRGHFHTACRLLADTSAAPPPTRSASFVATEDGGGGAQPDVVTVTLPGLPTAGEAQCAAWAGDGSHRTPMMRFASQIPAFDAVRLRVN